MTASRLAAWLPSLAIVALILAGALALPTPPAHAAPSVQNGKIAFESNEPFPGQPPGFSIYSINPDGSNMSGPLVDETSETTPAYSPDGSQIAWGTYLLEPPACGGGHVIAVMNADGSNPNRVADRCTDYGSVNGTEFNYPAWSPDGTRLAFMCTNPNTSGENVCLADSADGGDFAQLTNYAAFDVVVHPSWSPDGSQIAYAVTTDGGITYEVHVMNADGSNDHAITPTPDIGWASDPAWSPDGTRIAFTGIDGDGLHRVFVMNPDGSDPVQLTPSGTNSDDRQPAWSPDGTEIAFTSSRVTATWNIWKMNADGSNLAAVTLDANTNDEPSWGPQLNQTPPTLISSASCSANTVTVGDTLSCTQSATGGVEPYNFEWDLGSTKIGTGADLSYVFTTPGLYVVTATVTDAAGTTAGSPIFITVQAAPTLVALASCAANTVTVGDPLSCTVSATGGVAPYSISWDIGDTQVGAGVDLSYAFTQAGPTVLTATVTDALGNTAGSPIFLDVQAAAAPSVTIALTAPNGGTPNGQNGWFVTAPVTGTVTADATNTGGGNITSLDCGSLALTVSGLGTPTATGTFSIASDGVTHISCTAADSGGSTSRAVTKDVKLDTVKPTLNPAIAPTRIFLHSRATAIPNASDATSGVASQSCGPVDTSSAGLHTVTCTSTDKAGNQASRSVGYLVQYRIRGFFSPAPSSKWKSGQTVPIKIALADAAGTRIADTAAQKLLSPTCRITVSVRGAQTTSACMKYDTTAHQFVYRLKLGTTTGNDTITVSVSYPGTNTTTVLSEAIRITRS
jgi:Tol biopolymer transport system component